MGDCAETPFGPIYPIPFWIYILKHASNILLVVNSSIDPVIYCQFSKLIDTRDLRRLIGTVICCPGSTIPITHEANEQHEMQEAMLAPTIRHRADGHRHDSLNCKREYPLAGKKRRNSI